LTTTFNCPTCGAPLDYGGNGDTLRCPYCNNSVIVPQELRQSAYAAGGPKPSVPAATQALAAAPGDSAVPAEVEAQVRRLLQANQKIEAIKLYRQFTSVGLKEAKDAVEAMGEPGGQSQGKKKKRSFKETLVVIAVGLFFIGLGSIFPIVFIPMGIDSWQNGEIGGAIAAFFGAAVWLLVWGGIGVFIMFGLG